MTRETNDEDIKVKQSFGKTEFIWLFNWSDKWSVVRYPIPSFDFDFFQFYLHTKTFIFIQIQIDYLNIFFEKKK